MLQYSNIRCDGCDKPDFSGGHYECQMCPNFNLCVPCYNNKRQTLNHSSSHRMLLTEPSSTVNSSVMSRQHADQMDRLQDKYLSKRLTDLSVNDARTKLASPSIKTLDQYSIDELYEYLFRLDPSMILVADKLKNARVSGADLVNFSDDDYEKFSMTYGEKKKLQLLIEQKQTILNAQPVSSTSNTPNPAPIQSEITRLKEIVEKQEKEIQEKNQMMKQLENVIEQQDQQTQLQNAIIKQLQEALDKQSEEMRVLIELAQQYRSLTSAN
ncbi:unnamed protein product [Rotaria magnacalcarata]|uniref:ZZ-type domain-containing protein n=1 Tax=Rotaria magnacalcarata TaxID=392030 RepID=A0A814YLC7_9BILA|nr:unnamed protein product [Rotaria magnacalcarata]CAF1593663.1 unnamed protein product [Rotaria magnacalcarata]CAF2065364.1 unnamed protein product [Rotaria magnacalcarata]